MANDTDKKIEDIFNGMMKNKTGEERIKMGFSMFESAKKIALSTKPDNINNREFLFLRFYGNDFDDKTKKRSLKK